MRSNYIHIVIFARVIHVLSDFVPENMFSEYVKQLIL